MTDMSHFTLCRSESCSDIALWRAGKELGGAITLDDAVLLFASSKGFTKEDNVGTCVLKGALRGGINSPRPHKLQCQSKGESLS